MRYAMLIHEEPGLHGGLTEAEFGSIVDEFQAIREDPRFVDGARLQGIETATTVRVDGERTLVSDGPFAELKEVFAGYLVIEADDLDAAIAFAARIPSARFGASIEIRPLVQPPAR